MSEVLAKLVKRMEIEVLRYTLEGLWTVCSDGRSDPLDRYIDGISRGTLRITDENDKGTGVRIRFSGKDSRYL